MKKSVLLDEYLHQQGVSESTPKEEILEHKKAYRRAYQKLYYQRNRREADAERRKKTKAYYLRFSLAEDVQVRKALKAYMELGSLTEMEQKKLGVSNLLKQMALSYLDRKYIVPAPQLVAECIQQIRKIGTNINQICIKAHRDKDYRTGAAVEVLTKQITELEQVVIQKLEEPPEGIAEYVERASPTQIAELERLIEVQKQSKTDDYQKHEPKG